MEGIYIMIKNKKHIVGVLSIVFALSAGACANSDIVVNKSPDSDKPVFETQKNIVLDWSQIRSDAEEQFNDKTLYPMSDYIDMAFKENENKVLLIWSLSDDISDDEALAYGNEYIRAINDYAATQDFSIKKSSETSYGGLFDKYDLEIQLFRADDIMEDSKYIVNQVIKAGTDTNLQLQNNKKGDK